MKAKKRDFQVKTKMSYIRENQTLNLKLNIIIPLIGAK